MATAMSGSGSKESSMAKEHTFIEISIGMKASGRTAKRYAYRGIILGQRVRCASKGHALAPLRCAAHRTHTCVPVSQHGRGTLYLANGDKYTSDWRHGDRQGRGTWTGVNGNTFTANDLEALIGTRRPLSGYHALFRAHLPIAIIGLAFRAVVGILRAYSE